MGELGFNYTIISYSRRLTFKGNHDMVHLSKEIVYYSGW